MQLPATRRDAPDQSADTSALSVVVDPSRRRVLGLAVVAGTGSLLAACGGDDDSTGTAADPSPSDSEATSSAPEDEPTEDEPTEDETGDDSGGGGGGLVAVADVPVGGGVILADKKIVVTQPTEGTIKAFTAVCTHMACLVGKVENKTISCPCHGSTYSAVDGSVKGGPAPRPLAAISVKVDGDQVVES